MSTRGLSLGKVVATLLFVLAAVLSAVGIGAAMRPPAAREYRDRVWLPAEELVTQLQRERSASVGFLGGGRARPQPLADQRTRTDAAVAAFRGSTSDRLPDLPDPVQRRLGELAASLGTLGAARETIDGGELSRAGAMRLYTGMVASAYHLFVALADAGDRDAARQGRAAVAVGRARDLLAQEDALLAGVTAAGRLTEADRRLLVQAIGAQRAGYAAAAADLPTTDLGADWAVGKAEPMVRLRALEDRVLTAAGAAPPVRPAEWGATYDGVAEHLRAVELTAAQATAHGGTSPAWLLVRWLLAALALVAAGLAALRWLRSGRPLPGAPGRRPPPAEPLVGRVPRASLQPGAAEARRRRGLAEVFLTIAQRDQDLLHRQLSLLDGLERRVSDPAVLEDLFRVDHLATRMRRHMEDLVTLAGAVPGRGWRRPVPMVDVIRGAVSEVEDFARVGVVGVADAALVGRAVGDTMHLLAELIENGASFSPPDSRVHVSGSLLADGYLIEVTDSGEGMGATQLAEANRRLAAEPGFDGAADAVADGGARLGLLVVSQLAARHGIRVELRRATEGGVTATVRVPPELVAVDPEERPEPVARGRAAIGGGLAAIPAARPAAAEPPTGPALWAGAAPGPMEQPAVVAGAVADDPPPTANPRLPKRVPQASLAAELHDAPDAAGPARHPGRRTPAELGSRLSALQAGVRRAKTDGEDR